MHVAIKELSGILLVWRHRAAGWTKEDGAEQGGWGSQGLWGGNKAAYVHITTASGTEITCREISGLWTYEKENRAKFNFAVCFQYSKAENWLSYLCCEIYIVDKTRSLECGFLKGAGSGHMKVEWHEMGAWKGTCILHCFLRAVAVVPAWRTGLWVRKRVNGNERWVLSGEEGKMCQPEGKVQQKGDLR